MLYILTNMSIIVEYKLRGMDHPKVELVCVTENKVFEALTTGTLVGDKLVTVDLTPSVEFGLEFDPTNTKTFKVHGVGM